MTSEKIKTHSFFVEMILVILFFSISAVVVLQLFAAAGQESRDSMDLNEATLQAQRIAEDFIAWEDTGPPFDFLDGVSRVQEQNGTFTAILYLDADWKSADAASDYCIQAICSTDETPSGQLQKLRIEVYRQTDFEAREEPLFHMDCQKYRKGGLGVER